MAEDVNFPLDQTRNTSAFQGLREISQETTRPRRTEEEREELNEPEQAAEEQEQQPVNEVASLESRVELSQEARQQAGEDPQIPTDRQNQEPQQDVDIAAAERREFQAERQGILEEATAEFRNPGSQGPAGANELGRVSEGFIQDSDELLNEQIRSGNDVADPDRIEEFENGARIDSVQEAVVRAGEDAVAVEEEDPARPLEGAPSIREVSEEGIGPQGRERLEQDIRSETPTPDESAREELQGNRVSASDARIQERINEERAAAEEDALRNDPAFDTPEQTIEQVEGEPEEPIQEGLDTNPLRGPRPSELRDDSDASAVETERGQNVSRLI
ncbi:MAG: hypothetical protein F3745_06015 [Nitrospinae bacterium]|nr:hypothetical protein [Nitrospinota bacterium]